MSLRDVVQDLVKRAAVGLTGDALTLPDSLPRPGASENVGNVLAK